MEKKSVVALFPNGSTLAGCLFTLDGGKQLFFNYRGISVPLPSHTILIAYGANSPFLVVPTYEEAKNSNSRIIFVKGLEAASRKEVDAVAKSQINLLRK